ncbi:MAG: type II secretion system secretin GspD [Deltaproteobacteria bacterium]|nr:type II secretion system secretin GspD [Deltaproteobacteria bacterium]
MKLSPDNHKASPPKRHRNTAGLLTFFIAFTLIFGLSVPSTYLAWGQDEPPPPEEQTELPEEGEQEEPPTDETEKPEYLKNIPQGITRPPKDGQDKGRRSREALKARREKLRNRPRPQPRDKAATPAPADNPEGEQPDEKPPRPPVQAQQRLPAKPPETDAPKDKSPAPAQPAKENKKPAAKRAWKKGDLIEMNFNNIEINSFLKLMSETLDVPMLWDESQIRGNITLISPKKFKQEDALQIFETVLSMNGFTTIRTVNSPLVQVVQTKDASRLPSRTITKKQVGKDDNFFITQIFPLKYADANQIKAALSPLTSKTAAISVYVPANVLVISDVESSVERLIEIIDEMDIPPGDIAFRLVTLNYAQASKLAPLLTSLGSVISESHDADGSPTPSPRGRRTAGAKSSGASSDLKVVAYETTNTLIIVGEPTLLEKFLEIIAKLDVPGSAQERGVKVFRLQHADAEELVTILKNMNIKGPVAQAAPKAGSRPAPQKGGTAAGSLNEMTFTADKATNSIIAFGEPDMIETLELMLKELDVRRPQVFVEILIMEISLEKSLQLGVRWQSVAEVSNGVAGVGVPDATPNTLEGALASSTGAVVGVLGNTISFQGQEFVSFSGFIQASQQDQDFNVLANPQILTLNNQEAEINVSQVVPVSTRTVTNNQLQTTTEYEFKDIGIILKITPQITGEDRVRLIIQQESSSIAARQDVYSSTQQAVTTLKRSINTQVVVDDNNTMAIGGLIQEQNVETENKVPCLGDIWGIGWLFKSKSNQLLKTNLVVFIRPKIVFSAEDMQASTHDAAMEFRRATSGEEETGDILRGSFKLTPADLDKQQSLRQENQDGEPQPEVSE